MYELMPWKLHLYTSIYFDYINNAFIIVISFAIFNNVQHDELHR